MAHHRFGLGHALACTQQLVAACIAAAFPCPYTSLGHDVWRSDPDGVLIASAGVTRFMGVASLTVTTTNGWETQQGADLTADAEELKTTLGLSGIINARLEVTDLT